MVALISSYLPETATAVVVSTVVYVIYIVVSKVLAYWSSPIWDLRGPKSVNWLTGSYERNVWEADGQDKQLEWTREYGPVFRYHGWFNVSVVFFRFVLLMPKLEVILAADQGLHVGSPRVESHSQCS
jgi:hypothetical protein